MLMTLCQTCQVSRIWRETHAFEVYLTLSRRQLKSHAFASTAVTTAQRLPAPQIRRSILDFVRITNHCIVLYCIVLFSSSFCDFSLLRLDIALLLQTKITKNCHHQMRFLGSNATEMRWRPGLCPGPRWGALVYGLPKTSRDTGTPGRRRDTLTD